MPEISWLISVHSYPTPFRVYVMLRVFERFDDGARHSASELARAVYETGLASPYKHKTKIPKSEEDIASDGNSFPEPFSKLGLIYSGGGRYRLAPISRAYLNGELSYSELVLWQLRRWQIPNPNYYQQEGIRDAGVAVQPFVLTLQVLRLLADRSPEQAWLSHGELCHVVAQHPSHFLLEQLVDKILLGRESGEAVDKPAEWVRGTVKWFLASGLLEDDGDRIRVAPGCWGDVERVINRRFPIQDPSSYGSKEDWVFQYHGILPSEPPITPNDPPVHYISNYINLSSGEMLVNAVRVTVGHLLAIATSNSQHRLYKVISASDPNNGWTRVQTVPYGLWLQRSSLT